MPMFPNGLNRLRDFLRAARFSASTSVSLNALTVSNGSGTVGQALSSTISGLTSGSSVALTGAGAAGLSISGAVITGTPTTAGAVNIVETLAGATNSPNPTNGVVTIAATSGANYAAVTSNTQPATTLVSPTSDSFVVSTGSALAGSASGAGTWSNLPIGSNPGTHNKQADGSGVGGNAAGRAGSLLNGIVSADGEISADVLVFVTASEGQVSLLARANASDAAGTYYDLRFSFANQVNLYRVNAGVETYLTGVSVTAAASSFYNLRLRAIDFVDAASGNTYTALRAFFNGAEVFSYIDTTPLPAGVYGIRGGRNCRWKNFNVGAWQLQPRTVFTPNVYDQSASGAIVSGITVSTAGATMTLANNDGGRFALVDTGMPINGRKTYNVVATSTTTKIADGQTRSIQITEAKSGYASVTNTIPLGVVAPLPARPTRLASAGGHIPNAVYSASGTAATAYKSQVPWYVGSDDKSRLQFVFDNWTNIGFEATTTTGGANINAGLTVTKAAFYIPSAPIPLVPVTFNGGRALTLALGDAAILSDPIYPAQFGLTVFPRGMLGFLRCAGATVGVGNVPAGMYAASVAGSYMEIGTAVTDTQVDSTANMTAEGGTTKQQSTGASAMWGTSVNTGVLATMFLGDSITEGLQEVVNATPFGKGWAARSAGDNTSNSYAATPGSLLAFMQHSHSGDSNWATSSAGTTRTQKHWAACNVLVEAFGTNDIGTAGTGNASTIRNNAVSTWGLFRAASPGGKVLRTTLQARTTQKITLASLTGDGTSLATATTAVGQPLPAVGATFPITIAGATPAGYNGTFTATVTAASTSTTGGTFTYPIASGLASPATGTITAGDADQSPYFQVPLSGWGTGGVRDQLIASFRTDLTNNLLDGIIETNNATSPANDNTRWSAGTVTTEGDGFFTHPFGAGGNAPIADAVRAKLLALTGLA